MAEGSTSRERAPGGASGVVLATKLYVPSARPDAVSRPRLVARLDEGGGAPFTLVSAPAGFGKTTLVAEWVAESNRPVAWVSLDESENDPADFGLYLVAALRSAHPDLGESVLAMYRGAAPSDPKLAVAHLINEVAERDLAVALVLDDYHLVTAEAVHETVAFLVEHLPPRFRVILTTRADPPLPLARWRARGAMREVRAADLRFAGDETAAFLNGRMGLSLGDGDLLALATRTEGWITGLQLAAISLRSRDDASEFVRAFAGDDRYVLDYLAEEVLHRQPEEVQRFLLRTSVLGRLRGALCDAVTDGADGRASLERLERENLFLTPLDNKREWFRYHHLFADLLRYRLEAQEPDLVPELHRRASAWFEAEGLANEAIQHAVRARDWPRAVGLVNAAAQPMLMRRQLGTIRGWLNPIPPDDLKRSPFLCSSYAVALMGRSDWEGVERHLGYAEAALQGDALRSERSVMWSVRAFVGFARRDAARALECAATARELVAEGVSLEGLASGIATSLSMLATGRVGEAEGHIEAALATSRVVGHVFAQNALLAYLGHVRATAGRLGEAADTVRELLSYESDQFPEHVGFARLLLADAAREANDLDAAAAEADRYFEIQAADTPEGHWFLHADRVRYLTRLARAFGDRARADEAVAWGIERGAWHGIRDAAADAEALRAVVALWWGDVDAASRWAAESGLGPDDEPSFEREARHLALARVLLAEERAEEALRLIARLRAAALAAGRRRVALELLVLEALAHRALGRDEAALDAAERALADAEPEGYIRTFVDEGDGARSLLEAWASRRARSRAEDAVPSAAYVARLLEAFGAGAPVQDRPEAPATASELPWWYERDPLHKRELEVLGLVAEGLSNDAIATRLFIAVSTVKRHVSNIYQKLDVHSRTQAVARARAFGLFGGA